jgi:hypothetical protein
MIFPSPERGALVSNKTNSVVSSILAFGLCTPLLLACMSDTATTSPDGVKPPSGSSGDGGSGGSSGGSSSGSDSGGGGPASGLVLDLIDDMEGGTGSILASKGRVGAWYTYNDGTAGAVETPPAGEPFVPSELSPARETSHFAARMSGSGFTTWGAGMGLNLNDPGSGDGGSAKATYDASAYDGIAFWAKTAAGPGASLRLNVSDKDTDPSGGLCAPAAKCSDHFGKSLNITSEWVQYVIRFSDMAQLGWGASVPAFDAKSLYAIQFQVAKGAAFDVWIDDVAFVGK